MAMAGVEFCFAILRALRRFCLHILPLGFQRIRHYGILSNFHKTGALAAACASLNVTPAKLPTREPRAKRVRALLENFLGRPLTDCPACGATDSLVRILRPPNAPAPPPDFVYPPVK